MKHHIPSAIVLALALWTTPVVAQSAYQKPPPEVLEVLNAPRSPSIYRSPTMKDVLLAQWVVYPSIADLAQPMLRLAGIRINPRNNSLMSFRNYITKLSVQTMPDGDERAITLPPGARPVLRCGMQPEPCLRRPTKGRTASNFGLVTRRPRRCGASTA